MTGVTAGAMGFIGAVLIAGLRRAAFLAGFFFFEAFLEDFFLEDFFFAAFLDDFFFAAFFLDVFFFATRFFADFFFAVFFLAVFFFAAFFFAALFNSFQCWTDVVVRGARSGFPSHYQAFDSHRTRLVRRFYAQRDETRACQA